MTALVFAAAGILPSGTAQAQNELPPLDKSPMDMAYCPAGYPYLVRVKGQPGKLVARVIYSRPQKNGREIFGHLEAYGEVWRLGANEATELDLYAPVTIGGKKLAPGRYTLYAIPRPDTWTLIVNKDTDIWGDYAYKQEKDVLRTEVPVQHPASTVEALSMVFRPADHGADLVIAWDNVQVVLPVGF